MMESITDLLDSMCGVRLLVIGDVILDGYWEGDCERLCPDAPAPVVELARYARRAGGAGNAAVNARALGATVDLLGAVGDDTEADELAAVLTEAGVSPCGLLQLPDRRTAAKRRILSRGQIMLRLDQGSKEPLGPAGERQVIERLQRAWSSCDAVLISDYDFGVLTPRVIGVLRSLQREQSRVVVADSKDLTRFRSVGLAAVKPNYRQFLSVVGPAPKDGRRTDIVSARAASLLERTGARIAAVTLDVDGACVVERGRPTFRTYTRPQPHGRACGAGDTYAAAFTLALAAGGDTPASAEIAAAAAAVVVAKEGTAVCTAREIRERLLGENKQLDREALIVRLDEERRIGRRIVFTNGCFDILHRGHVTYLSRAKSLGDLLVVGVNSDQSIRRLKGPTRPINSLVDRLEVLAALSCVDLLVPFDDDTPHELIRAVRPHAFVKGGDYQRSTLPEADLVESLGGEIHILPLVPDLSTTRVIRRAQGRSIPQNALFPAACQPRCDDAALGEERKRG